MLQQKESLGCSETVIHQTVARELEVNAIAGRTLLDLGCGTGELFARIGERFECWFGVDLVRYPGLSDRVQFQSADLDAGVPLPDGHADVVTAIEIIEHLENPWLFLRELIRLLRPGGWLFVSTPNQLSLLNLVSLAVRGRHAAFVDRLFPVHRTALLAVDLCRAAREAGLDRLQLRFTQRGRLPGTAWHYPARLARRLPCWCSDNVLLVGQKPDEARIE